LEDCQPGQKPHDPIWKITEAEKSCVCVVQMAEHLPSNQNFLS
jgi:hypothetical protein